jgi:hypothetical protein
MKNSKIHIFFNSINKKKYTIKKNLDTELKKYI